jgi:hypothetical protein
MKVFMPEEPEETDPIRAYAMQNAAREALKPRPRGGSWVLPFLAAVVITAVILAAAFYMWGN